MSHLKLETESSESAPNQALVDLAWQATVRKPHITANWHRLIRSLLSARFDQRAIEALTGAIRILPDDARLHVQWAQLLRRAGCLELARQILDQAPPVPSADRDTRILRLVLLMHLLPSTEKLRVATEMLSLDRANQLALHIVLTDLRRRGKTQDVIALCQTVLGADPGHTRARHELAVALAMLGRAQEARQLIDLNCFDEPRHTRVVFEWGTF
jgi:Flp pilus assembly protein TadD